MVSVRSVVLPAVIAAGSPLSAQSAAITESATSFSFTINGVELAVTRNGLSCPASCIQPMTIAPGVDTLGELEVIEFLQDALSTGSGLLIDVRLPATFSLGTVPGAVNVPVATFHPDNPYRSDLLSALGARNADAQPDFGKAYTLVMFGNGPDDGNSADAITYLLDAGYPADKIKYYRGGASGWSALGLSNAVGQ